jgi:hypothetical protein
MTSTALLKKRKRKLTKKKMNELEILNSEINGVKIKDMNAIPFSHWVAAKLNGVKAYSSAVNELNQLVLHPPMSKKMPDIQKIDIIRKLISIGVEIK